jgi:hypothetical protein
MFGRKKKRAGAPEDTIAFTGSAGGKEWQRPLNIF